MRMFSTKDEDSLDHMPVNARGRMAPLTSEAARRLRADLINKLKR